MQPLPASPVHAPPDLLLLVDGWKEGAYTVIAPSVERTRTFCSLQFHDASLSALDVVLSPTLDLNAGVRA